MLRPTRAGDHDRVVATAAQAVMRDAAVAARADDQLPAGGHLRLEDGAMVLGLVMGVSRRLCEVDSLAGHADRTRGSARNHVLAADDGISSRVAGLVVERLLV